MGAKNKECRVCPFRLMCGSGVTLLYSKGFEGSYVTFRLTYRTWLYHPITLVVRVRDACPHSTIGFREDAATYPNLTTKEGAASFRDYLRRKREKR